MSDKIKHVLCECCNDLLKKKNVVATGIGFKVVNGEVTDIPSIICSVEKKVSLDELDKKDKIPSTIDGIEVDVIETGKIVALASRTERNRPAPGGVSIGHTGITAGTLGCLVKKNGETYILSNNHVLANSNKASIGDAILQPGPIDGGKYPTDHIADLADFVKIDFGSVTGPNPDPPSECPIAGFFAGILNFGAKVTKSQTRVKAVKVSNIQALPNLVDAAIAKPLNDADVSAGIMGFGPPSGIATVTFGDGVNKSGRTTGITSGTVIQTNVTVRVGYGDSDAIFEDQIMTSEMSQGGDSGSAVLDDNNNLVGLLFAGSPTTTIINKIDNVFEALDITL